MKAITICAGICIFAPIVTALAQAPTMSPPSGTLHAPGGATASHAPSNASSAQKAATSITQYKTEADAKGPLINNRIVA